MSEGFYSKFTRYNSNSLQLQLVTTSTRKYSNSLILQLANTQIHYYFNTQILQLANTPTRKYSDSQILLLNLGETQLECDSCETNVVILRHNQKQVNQKLLTEVRGMVDLCSLPNLL